MVDDMSGLFGFASDAYREGKRTGKDEFYFGIIAVLGRIGKYALCIDNESCEVDRARAASHGEVRHG